METLATGSAGPANAEITTLADLTKTDVKVDDATGDGSAPSVPEADTPAPKKDAVQERIDKLTRDKYDNARLADQRGYELERERAERQRLESEIATLRKSETTQVAPDTFPTLESVGYDEDKFRAAVASYTKGMTESAKAEGKKAAEDAIRADRESANNERVRSAWTAKESELIKSRPDYVEKVQQARTLPISQEIQQELLASEYGPQVALFLVENRDKAEAILQLPLSAQLREIGRIEARLEAAKAPAKPAVSQAPPPPPKVESTETSLAGVSTTDPKSDAMSDAAWVKAENARLARKNKRA